MNTQAIITALKAASLALSASHNVTVTDRSDLPRDQWPIYILDHTKEGNLIDKALVSLGEKSCFLEDGTSTDNDPECGQCSSRPSTTSA